jgi:drug/metabolite transporter (DMT)-like permease
VARDWRVAPAAASTVIAWAAAFVAIRVAAPAFGPGELTAGRLLIASAVLACFIPMLGPVRLPEPRDLRRIVVCGVSGMAGYQYLLNSGERSVSAGGASLLVNTSPIFAAILAWLTLGEKISARGRAGMALGFVGAIIMTIGQGNSIRISGHAVLVLGAAVLFALFFVAQRPLLARYSSFELTCYATWSGAILTTPFLPSLVSEARRGQLHPIEAVIFLAVVSSAIGFVTWAYVQQHLPVATAVNILYLVPFTAIGIAWIALGESTHALAMAGGMIALVGVGLSRSTSRILALRPGFVRRTSPEPTAEDPASRVLDED